MLVKLKLDWRLLTPLDDTARVGEIRGSEEEAGDMRLTLGGVPKTGRPLGRVTRSRRNGDDGGDTKEDPIAGFAKGGAKEVSMRATGSSNVTTTSGSDLPRNCATVEVSETT